MEDLLKAVNNNDIESVKKLLPLLTLQKISINTVHGKGNWTVLHNAATYAQSEIITLLLEHGADKTLLDVNGNAPVEHLINNDTIIRIDEFLRCYQLLVVDCPIYGKYKEQLKDLEMYKSFYELYQFAKDF